MDSESSPSNPLLAALDAHDRSRLTANLDNLRAKLESQGGEKWPIPHIPHVGQVAEIGWPPAADWMSGRDAFELLRLQTGPDNDVRAFLRLFSIIDDQPDRKASGLNYKFSRPPPTLSLLSDFESGSTVWVRGVVAMFHLRNANEIPEIAKFAGDLLDWIAIFDCLRIRVRDVFDAALSREWHIEEYNLPEAKQDPIWSFPWAMSWIATRDYYALAKVGHFARSENDNAITINGVQDFSTRALGWLHTEISYLYCSCGALEQFGIGAFRHCTCISVAWEDLVSYRGGLSSDTPELVFNLPDGWLSMTWPDGADKIRFLRRDIIDRWPARSNTVFEHVHTVESTVGAESECKSWLAEQFAADTEKLRSKADFRAAALVKFSGRLTGRGFDMRVWPSLAADHGRSNAGAKKKS